MEGLLATLLFPLWRTYCIIAFIFLSIPVYFLVSIERYMKKIQTTEELLVDEVSRLNRPLVISSLAMIRDMEKRTLIQNHASAVRSLVVAALYLAIGLLTRVLGY